MDDSVRHFGSARPFGEFAKKYRDLGWLNPIPLPAKKKGPPPDGYTGHNANNVDLAQLKFWAECNEKDNIGLRLHSHKFDEWAPELIREQTFEIVGIDIDEHPEEGKSGWSQMLSLEKTLGQLPMTWCSSARTNGKAGIRFFLVPPNLAWRGDCGKNGPDIDIICRTYRFACVFPSFHPKGGQYYWYRPGSDPDGKETATELPRPEELSLLPQPWIEFLTQGFTQYTKHPMDMDSTDAELRKWATATFAEHTEMCPHMEKIITKRLIELENSDTSHPMLTKIHFELLRLGSKDGHTGWGVAVRDFERAWRLNVSERGKRGVQQAISEIERSRSGALRKIKGKYDEEATAGRKFFKDYDPCTKSSPTQDISDFPQLQARDPGDYRINDDGNAEHFLDMHEGLILYIPNVIQRWLLWRNERWLVDETDFVLTLFRRVRDAQEALAAKLWADYEKIANQKGAGDKKRLAETWGNWARNSGMAPGIARAISNARHARPNISVKYEDLDKDRRALGCADKVVRITKEGEIEVLENSRDLLITKNTGIAYIPWTEQVNHRNPEIRRGHQDFVKYLGTWIAPSVDVHYFQKLCGSILLGDTVEKMVVFFWGEKDSGKSTMLELLINALCDYAAVRNPDIFKGFHLNPALASALSARLLAVHEMGDNEINSPLFKTLSGGDKVQVELKGKNNIIVDNPQFTIFIDTNSVPRVSGEDAAFRSRLRVIEFKHKATKYELSSEGKAQQRELLEKGGTAVLAWLVEGAARYVKEGLEPIPDEIRLATEDFATQLSDLGVFAKECIERSVDSFVTQSDMYSCFEQYCWDNNTKIAFTSNQLTRRLKELDFRQTKKRIKLDDGSSEPVMVWVDCKLIRLKGNKR